MYSPSQWITCSLGPRITAVHRPPSRTSIETSSSAMPSPSPPYQSMKRSGSVHSRQTSSRGASKVQRISMSGLGSSGIAAPQASVHPLEAALPEPPIPLQPVGRILERLGLEVGGTELRPLLAGDQSRCLEHLEVLRDGLDRDREAAGELAEAGVTLGEALQDRAPGRVGERGEGPVELGGGHGAALNQMVEEDAPAALPVRGLQLQGAAHRRTHSGAVLGCGVRFGAQLPAAREQPEGSPRDPHLDGVGRARLDREAAVAGLPRLVTLREGESEGACAGRWGVSRAADPDLRLLFLHL